ncbi:MAG: hypothetical protein F6K16_38970, partial [Symploca sp. SIO2B6]|nr:hypothetical protein [Symploca sp. SIO2B6]
WMSDRDRRDRNAATSPGQSTPMDAARFTIMALAWCLATLKTGLMPSTIVTRRDIKLNGGAAVVAVVDEGVAVAVITPLKALLKTKA